MSGINRERVQKSDKGKGWCDYCDMALVGNYGRCRVCGRIQREGKTRIKGVHETAAEALASAQSQEPRDEPR